MLVVATLTLSGCGAIYNWDTMQLQSARKQAAQVLLADCQEGNKNACTRITQITHTGTFGD